MIGPLFVGILFIAMGVWGFMKREQNADARQKFYERFPWLPGPRSRRYHLIEQSVASLVLIGVGLAVLIAGVWAISN